MSLKLAQYLNLIYPMALWLGAMLTMMFMWLSGYTVSPLMMLTAVVITVVLAFHCIGAYQEIKKSKGHADDFPSSKGLK